jgi:hypothetical protein
MKGIEERKEERKEEGKERKERKNVLRMQKERRKEGWLLGQRSE